MDKDNLQIELCFIGWVSRSIFFGGLTPRSRRTSYRAEVVSAVRSSFTRTQVPAVHFPAGNRQETATAGAAKTSSWTGLLKGGNVLQQPEETSGSRTHEFRPQPLRFPRARRRNLVPALVSPAARRRCVSWGSPRTKAPLGSPDWESAVKRTFPKGSAPVSPPVGAQALPPHPPPQRINLLKSFLFNDAYLLKPFKRLFLRLFSISENECLYQFYCLSRQK